MFGCKHYIMIFLAPPQEMEECVKLLIRMADRYGAKGHSHAGKIKKCALAVEQCYRASSNNKMRDDDLELNSGTRKSARSKAYVTNHTICEFNKVVQQTKVCLID